MKRFHLVTIPEGQLPLKPKLTPGWGVAGTIMILTGLLYTLVGIKNQYIHTFLSTGYIVSLGVAVLIVYVMSTPVSNALQGGYVAAITLSGCALGVASIFFKELTEGLGCALGGFCVSMWILCLVPGGLLHTVPSKAIFISCFTLAAFAFYFSRYTRDWALLTMISFAGGTVVVLGIDCFSRAGLREFWAYVWQLNKNLFPLGADTYPVTKGIRVETAAIVIICLLGIVSQIKLWRIVREKREKRAAARAQDQQDLEQEEADVGRQIEAENARERREWERVYGDGEVGSSTASRVSGSEKKLRDSYAPRSDVEVIELADISDTDREQRGPAPLTEKDQDGKVTVRVAADDVPEGGNAVDDDGENGAATQAATAANAGPTIRAVSIERIPQSHRTSGVSEAPQVIPLPFTIPQDDGTQSHGDRSSIATFADEGDDNADIPSRQGSFAKRLSRGSTKLLRNLSPRSSHAASRASPAFGESSEELVIPRGRGRDDESSVAATLDNQSVDGSDRQSMLSPKEGRDIEISPSFGGSDPQPLSARSSLMRDAKRNSGLVAPETESQQRLEGIEDGQNSTGQTQAGGVATSAVDQSERPKSTTSQVSSHVSLTKERLPRSLSRVALSYRTNEWAKHLSYADAPEPDELQMAQEQKQPKTKSEKEKAVPVNVEELQQGTEEASIPPAVTRSDSRLSASSVNVAGAKRDSATAAAPPITSPLPGVDFPERDQTFSPPLGQHANGWMVRSPSLSALRRTSSTFEPIAEEHQAFNNPDPIPEELDDTRSVSAVSVARSQKQAVPGIVSYSSPQTLLGQREMFLRSKSQGNLLSQTPDPYISTSRPTSDAGSMVNFPMYAAALATDPDDMPLSQRKQMIHRNHSMMSLSGQQPQPQPQPGLRRSSSGIDVAENAPFDSHQPKRTSTLPTQAARENKLAQFRNSVAHDLHAGNPMMAGSGRETQFGSASPLLGGREAEVQRSIQMQRNMLLSQKEAEAQRREMQRQEKEWTNRAFDERMRSGELMDAHREAMKKLQQGSKGK